MRTIQDVGIEILNNNPSKFYVFAGPEYGIKLEYINLLKQYYKNFLEYTSVSAVLDLMHQKHLIPLSPKLYIIRYDDSFITSLNSSSEQMIKYTNIVGTVVVIYESEKHINKLDKYLSNYTVLINKLDGRYIQKHLHQRFPKLPDNLINVATDICSDYSQAMMICKSLSYGDHIKLCSLNPKELSKMFGYSYVSTLDDIKQGVAHRNFISLLSYLNSYEGDLNSILYSILSTLQELDKLFSTNSKYSNSDIKDCQPLWQYSDIYNLYIHTYQVLQEQRSVYSSDLKNRLIYLFSLLNFQPIPSLEDLCYEF